MFSDKTFEKILSEALAMAPDDIDIRQGSIYYNHVAPVAFMIARYYNEMQITVDLISIETVQGYFLDAKAQEHALYRIPAQHCVRIATFEGATVGEGVRFFADGYYFTSFISDEGETMVQAEQAGEEPNTILNGTELVPVVTVSGLTRSTLGRVTFAGTEIEDDDNLRRRLQEKIAGPAENGNAQHYKTWCETVSGVGVARIDALWNGQNTVRAILIGADGTGATEDVVKEVQEYVDPNSEGLGEGVANIGAYFTAETATSYPIDISFKVQLLETAQLATVEEEIKNTLIVSLKETSLACASKDDMMIRIAMISNTIYDTTGVVDYQDLLVNNDTANLVIPFTHAPEMGELKIEQIPRT